MLLATPVGQIPALFGTIAPALGSATVLTDAGSTKQDVIAAARRYLGKALPRFVPGHPIAGTERSGAAAASDSLFCGKSVILKHRNGLETVYCHLSAVAVAVSRIVPRRSGSRTPGSRAAAW